MLSEEVKETRSHATPANHTHTHSCIYTHTRAHTNKHTHTYIHTAENNSGTLEIVEPTRVRWSYTPSTLDHIRDK